MFLKLCILYDMCRSDKLLVEKKGDKEKIKNEIWGGLMLWLGFEVGVRD